MGFIIIIAVIIGVIINVSIGRCLTGRWQAQLGNMSAAGGRNLLL
jgi:hypothetical protein